MKLLAAILGICLLQMCSGDEDSATKIKSYLTGSNAIKDIGRTFVDNVNILLERYPNNAFVKMMLLDMMEVLAREGYLNGHNAKIDVKTVTDYCKTSENIQVIDKVYAFKSVLSRQTPPEQVHGIINLMLMLRQNATDANESQIENALGYLYGTEVNPMRIRNIEPLSSEECGREHHARQTGMNTMHYLRKLKETFQNHALTNSKFIEDMSDIVEQLPCNRYIYQLLYGLTTQLGQMVETDPTHIDVCEMAREVRFAPYGFDENMIAIEATLNARITYRDHAPMMNVFRVFNTMAKQKDIQNALEYIYGSDVYKTIPARGKC